MWCYECLESRIGADFSGGAVFRYGVSDSPLPLASSAVVQIYVNGSEGNAPSEGVSDQFVLVGLSVDNKKECFENGVVKECHGTENNSSLDRGQCERELDVGSPSDGTPSSSQTISSSGRVNLIYFEHGNSLSNFCKQSPCVRMIAALTPVSHVGEASSITIREIVSKYLCGSTEDHVISSLNMLAERKVSGWHGVNFLNLVGFSSFDGTSTTDIVRHPNICPVLGVLETPDYCYLLHPKAPYTLENILHYSPKAFQSDWHVRFFIYQIISALGYLHGLGVSHGNISPSTILLTNFLWPWLSVSDMRLLKSNSRLKDSNCPSSSSGCLREDCPCRTIYSESKLSMSVDFHSNFKRWWEGELSNYDYLLVLNKLAGRRWGDHTFHTVMPWVIDFTVKPDERSDLGWRDLTKSKWRLAKGDEQLDFTYSTSEVPHHVSDECLSELAVCSYKARRLPLAILKSAVRSVYEPNEYPSSMQRLYQWTPDECIPEFYSDPRIFISRHSEMINLAVPSWASNPEEFILLHREALESERVSRQLHHWIDITFGYKLSGLASVEAKNVMLPVSDPLRPKSIGRRQLFTKAHPMRRGITPHSSYCTNKKSCIKCQKQANNININGNMVSATSNNHLSQTHYLEDLEAAMVFSEHARHLNPIYNYREDIIENCSSLDNPQSMHSGMEILEQPNSALPLPPEFDFASFVENFEADDTTYMGFQELLHWRQKSSTLGVHSENCADDIFSIGCILAELYIQRPLFDPVSLAAYKESDILPGALQELSSPVALLVEACIQGEWNRRPSAKYLLESQYFPPSVRSAYMFLAPLQLSSKSKYRLQYAAKLASEGALKLMGSFAAEMCAPYCLPLVKSPLSDAESESALCLLREFLKCLKNQAAKELILPIIQKILQADSFVRDLWKKLGKPTYLEKVHPLVISNLNNSPNKIAASAAAVVLIGSSEELGIPITTILPLIHSFGKGLCADGIDALIRIGALLGEKFIVKQLLPLLRNVVLSCIEASQMNKPEPQQSWNSLTLIDCFSALAGLVSALPVMVVLKELVQDQICLHVKVLLQSQFDLRVTQVAAIALVGLCQRIGPEYTSMYILPNLKELFAELAFSQITFGPTPSGRSLKISKLKLDDDVKIESRMDLVLLLYPFLASLLGIEKIRQCCSTWFLLEQMLQKCYNWKWESFGETSKSGESSKSQRLQVVTYSSAEHNPAKLLLNGVGWSIPQSQGVKGGMTITDSTKENDLEQLTLATNLLAPNFENHEPWFWFPSCDSSWDGPDFLGRSGGLKDEIPWKIKASVLHSARAHPGALRSIVVCDDECTVFTGGVGPGFKGSIQRWELPKMNCISGYYGHDEVVNAICLLSTTGRIASCDGTIHVWSAQTGKLIAAYAESSTNSPHQTIAKMNADQTNMLTPSALSGGILSNAFSGSLYTCMHYLESDEKLVAGVGNGSLRLIDVVRDQKLHLWRTDSSEHSFSSLVSAICSCGSKKLGLEGSLASSSWIAAGLSSGQCRLLDMRSGNVIALWRAHDGYITKLAAPEDHLLVSSSLDKTLRVWDLRRNVATPSNVYRGHSDGISSFSVWGQDVISVSRNKIALTSLARSTDEIGGEQRLIPRKLYSADKGMRNLSILSTVSVLPFSRLLLVGTEDGYLKICC
uniref:Protein GFS12 n=1 Tax=Ananas comosus var. bracteatus TaxID=296719 RepID=A0A6V7PFQ7_ANACO|nr:unnamed protein product [Ananas comosus var. bracteatus]